jgi:hypothetical protein
MTCREVQALLPAFLEKSLDAIRTKAIEAHLNFCSACRLEVRGLSDCVRRIADLPIVEPPVDLAERVMARVREIEAEPGRWQRWLAAMRASAPVQAAAVVMIGVLAVLLYQRENRLFEADSSATAPAAQTHAGANALSAEQVAPAAKSLPESGSQTQRPSRSEANRPPKQDQGIPSTGQSRSPTGAEPATAADGIPAPRRRPLQAQEVSTGRDSFRPAPDAFGRGMPLGALSSPFRSSPLASPEGLFSPLSEPQADIELIVRRRLAERRDHASEDPSSASTRKRAEADAAISSAVAQRAVPAPAAPSSIVEMRWFGVPADRYEEFRRQLDAEAHIDSERPLNASETKSSRDLLIKVIILPTER